MLFEEASPKIKKFRNQPLLLLLARTVMLQHFLVITVIMVAIVEFHAQVVSLATWPSQ